MGEAALKFAITDDVIDSQTRIVEPHGEIDMATASTLRERLAEVLDAGSRYVIIDLVDVGFLDSTSLRVMLHAQRRLAPAGGRLIVVCPDPLLMRVFEITGLDAALRVTDSLAEALSEARQLAEQGDGSA